MHVFELKVPPPLVLLSCMAGMWMFSRLFPGTAFSLPHAGLVAAVLALLGAAIALAGILEFRRQRTTIHPIRPEETTSIVTRGVYHWTRNPMYLGLSACLLAFGLYLGNAASLTWLVAFVAYITTFQIKPEERVLEKKFGAEYSSYRLSVRRWL